MMKNATNMCKGRVTGIGPRPRSSLELGENLEIGLARHAPDGGQGGGYTDGRNANVIECQQCIIIAFHTP